ncbi:MAG: chemotaxis protein CheW, partial [Nitrospirota bacterium]
YGNPNGLNETYYDGESVFYRIAEYNAANAASWRQCAQRAERILENTVDQMMPPPLMLGEADTTAPGKFPSRVCLLAVCKNLYAVDLRHIREILPIDSITPIPGMPPVVIGMTNVRGAVVPIVDLRLLLELSQAETLPPFAVVLRHEDYELAILVDRSPEIMTVLPEQFEPAPNSSPEDSEASRFIVNGIVRIDDTVHQILDVTQLVAYLDSEETIENV